VENENYLGLHIFRFYIKCPRCIAEIAFKVRDEDFISRALLRELLNYLHFAEIQERTTTKMNLFYGLLNNLRVNRHRSHHVNQFHTHCLPVCVHEHT